MRKITLKKLFNMELDITEGVIWKQIMIFFIPILFGSFFQQLYNTVDAIIVGNFLGKEALSAVGGATGTLIDLMVGFFVSLSAGATVIISQYYGARKDREVSQAVHTSIALAIAGGFILMIVNFFVTPFALKVMKVPEEIMDYSLIYIRIYFIGLIPNLIYNIGSAILRAVGDSTRPLIFLIVACLTNIVLDLLFVVVFKWGVAGVAIATIVSQLVSSVLVILVLARSQQCYRLYFHKIKFYKNRFNEIIRIGVPNGIQSIMYSSSNILVQVAINTLGTNTIAAWTAFAKMDSIFWMMIGAFSVSITTFAGQNFGAKKYTRVKKGINQCLGLTALGTIIMSLIYVFFGKYIFYIFNQDAEVIEKGMIILRWISPTYITFICVDIIAGGLRGMGISVIPTVMTAVGICLFRVVWVFFVVPLNRTIPTIALCYPLSWTLTSIMFIAYYIYFWKKNKNKYVDIN
ncbi:putative efflux protein, MATE family [Hathewaya proteolytica DSM 3090]|uniref:Probable multidrug resistance protein NorM n=1 Tax=Hathewaya proteolytica DSM 3090 TaxID=1121331 RepID=A0A1M6N7X8_9CLOT|nr:putative efflux protein, MATE family [Hathewaya proteolytica DSM 3090]